MYFVFLSSLPLLPEVTTAMFGSYTVIILLWNNTLSPVRDCLSIWLERFRGKPKRGRAWACYYSILPGTPKIRVSISYLLKEFVALPDRVRPLPFLLSWRWGGQQYEKKIPPKNIFKKELCRCIIWSDKVKHWVPKYWYPESHPQVL